MSTSTPWTRPVALAAALAVLCAAASALAESGGEARDLALSALRLEFERDKVAATSDELEDAFKQACEKGYNAACRRSNWLVEDRPDPAKSLDVFKPSCESGDPVACMVVGWSLDETAGAMRAGSEDQSRTWRRAAKLFKDTCDSGFPAACHDYGVFLYENKGLTADPRTALNRWKKACDDQEWASCTALAEPNRDGAGKAVRQNTREATRLAELACDGGYADGCAVLGSIQDPDWDAVKLDGFYGDLCERGHKDSCWTLARAYYDGIHPEPSEGRTNALFERGCELGHGRSCFEAGRWMEDSGTDDAKATAMYGLACDLGDAAGCAAQVDMFLTGKVPGSVKEAPEAFEVACEDRQSVEACTQLAYALIEGVDVPRDAERGRGLLERACVDESSDMIACANLAQAYQEGLGGNRDRTTASQYFRWACVAGHFESCEQRGDLLSSDVGVRRDDHEALNMYDRACEGGRGSACRKAGVILDEGTFVGQDLPRAASFYQRGCEASDHRGCYSWGTALEKGLEGQPDMAGARAAYEQAIDHGSTDAKRSLARLLWFGYGGKKDKRRAKKLASEACQNGDPVACRGPSFLGE